MEWLLALLIVVPAIIAPVIWDIQSSDAPKQASPAVPSSGATRPLLTGLAGLTLLGWGLFVYAKLDEAENQRGARREILALSANEEALRSQIAQLEQSAGPLADLQDRIAAATSRYNQAAATREQAQGMLASVQKDLEAQRQQLAQVSQQLKALMQQLSEARVQTQQAEQRIHTARSETESLQQARVERTRELAEVGKQLEAARQQEAQVREELARLAQEAAVRAASVAQAEHRLQQAREAEASQQERLAPGRRQMEEINAQKAQSEQALAAFTADRDKLASEIRQGEQRRAQGQQALARLTGELASRNRELAAVDGRLQSALREMADTQSQLADVRRQLADPSTLCGKHEAWAGGSRAQPNPRRHRRPSRARFGADQGGWLRQ